MDDWQKEREEGLSRFHLWDVRLKRKLSRGKYRTPCLGHVAHLFCVLSKSIVERVGIEEGEAIIRAAIEDFGRERGRRIALTVKSLQETLSLRNFLIYSDIDTEGLDTRATFEDRDLVVKVGTCPFMTASREWGFEEYAGLYCRYIDKAIIEGYNPDIRLIVEPRTETGRDHCTFRYRVRKE